MSLWPFSLSISTNPFLHIRALRVCFANGKQDLEGEKQREEKREAVWYTQKCNELTIIAQKKRKRKWQTTRTPTSKSVQFLIDYRIKARANNESRLQPCVVAAAAASVLMPRHSGHTALTLTQNC